MERSRTVDATERMYEAAGQALAALQRMTRRGRNPVTEALDGAAQTEEWTHYPAGDACGANARYYYHAHCAEEMLAGEHGHFHIFLQTPSGVTTHVVGIAMDGSGRVLQLFTTNVWVTGEMWRPADEIIATLDDFHIKSAVERRDLDLWVTSIVRMFLPQIADLLRERDRVFDTMLARDAAAREDRSARILSAMPVDLVGRIAALEQALA